MQTSDKLKSRPKTAELDKFLEKLSGGEISDMLSFYLASSKGKPLQAKLNLNDKKFSKVIENIGGQHQNATPNNKESCGKRLNWFFFSFFFFFFFFLFLFFFLFFCFFVFTNILV